MINLDHVATFRLVPRQPGRKGPLAAWQCYDAEGNDLGQVCFQDLAGLDSQVVPNTTPASLLVFNSGPNTPNGLRPVDVEHISLPIVAWRIPRADWDYHHASPVTTMQTNGETCIAYPGGRFVFVHDEWNCSTLDEASAYALVLLQRAFDEVEALDLVPISS
jgi:hypothetical protein